MNSKDYERHLLAKEAERERELLHQQEVERGGENNMDIPRLIYLAMRINSDDTDTEVFVYISPHVKRVTINVYLDGWDSVIKPDLEYVIDYENPGAEYNKALTKLTKLIELAERNLE